MVAVVEESGRPVIVGGGRYVVVQLGKAEVAFAVVDQYQAPQGIGASLMHHLAAIARVAGLDELIAEVLPDNIPMLKVFEIIDLFPTARQDWECGDRVYQFGGVHADRGRHHRVV